METEIPSSIQQLHETEKANRELQKKLQEQADVFYAEFKRVRNMEAGPEKHELWQQFLKKYPSAPLPPQTLLES